jgi:hypothetical protein
LPTGTLTFPGPGALVVLGLARHVSPWLRLVFLLGTWCDLPLVVNLCGADQGRFAIEVRVREHPRRRAGIVEDVEEELPLVLADAGAAPDEWARPLAKARVHCRRNRQVDQAGRVRLPTRASAKKLYVGCKDFSHRAARNRA